MKDHYIPPHSDREESVYSSIDPISSFSCGIGSVLVITLPKEKSMCPKTNRLASNGILVYQPPNSVLVMAGEFQKQLYHGVLSWTQMNKLFLQQEITEFMDSKSYRLRWINNRHRGLFEEEMKRLQTLQTHELVRWNMTVRWMRYHRANCEHARNRLHKGQKVASTLNTEANRLSSANISETFEIVKPFDSHLSTENDSYLNRWWWRHGHLQPDLFCHGIAKYGFNGTIILELTEANLKLHEGKTDVMSMQLTERNIHLYFMVTYGSVNDNQSFRVCRSQSSDFDDLRCLASIPGSDVVHPYNDLIEEV